MGSLWVLTPDPRPVLRFTPLTSLNPLIDFLSVQNSMVPSIAPFGYMSSFSAPTADAPPDHLPSWVHLYCCGLGKDNLAPSFKRKVLLAWESKQNALFLGRRKLGFQKTSSVTLLNTIVHKNCTGVCWLNHTECSVTGTAAAGGHGAKQKWTVRNGS